MRLVRVHDEDAGRQVTFRYGGKVPEYLLGHWFAHARRDAYPHPMPGFFARTGPLFAVHPDRWGAPSVDINVWTNEGMKRQVPPVSFNFWFRSPAVGLSLRVFALLTPLRPNPNPNSDAVYYTSSNIIQYSLPRG